MTRFVRIFALIVVLSSALARLYAHPHMWIDFRVHPIVTDNTVEFVRIEWFFDEFYSSSLILDMDTNKDRFFQREEVREIHDNAFDHLIESEYFAVIRIDGNEIRIQKAQDFNTRIEDGVVVYEFSLPLNTRMSIIDKINVTFFDAGYFISFQPSSDQLASQYFDSRVSMQTIESLGWGEVQVPTLNWIKN